MQKLTDEAVRKAKLGKLRAHVDFKNMLNDMVKTDRADILVQLVSPLFMPKVKKTFDITAIDNALENKPVKYQEAEKVSRQELTDIVFEDEVEEKRIRDNYVFLMDNILSALEVRDTFTLEEFNNAMKKLYSPDIVKNGDYYSFFVNLCQKKEYCIGGDGGNNESFLDEYVKEAFADKEPVTFSIGFNGDGKLALFDGCEVSDLVFVRG